MRTVADVYEILDRMAPFSRAADWDPVGLQVGDLTRSADLVAVCHEVNDEVIEAAISAEVELLVAYHPLLFAPTTSLTAGQSPAGRVLRIAEAGIGLIVTHTAFDVAPGGTAAALARSLRLTDVEEFGAEKESEIDGEVVAIGRIGRRAPGSLADLAAEVSEVLESPALRLAGNGDMVVATVAVVPGSGADFATSASRLGADVLVTGDVSHHRAVAAGDLGLAIVDAGHIPTERPGLAVLVAALSSELGRPVIDLTAISTDPWS